MVTNINNFNVIWLLTRDLYVTADQQMAAAGATEVDLLVTWLYRLTQDQSNYKMASVIGILVFAVCSAITLTAFTPLTREGKEAAFR
jgi:arabinogalactan oligomer/maltooligosaccharide transport system permease protein